jgi:hypothetical protein
MRDDFAEALKLMNDVAGLRSAAGERVFTDSLSAWSRKLQVFVLAYASLTALLASGLVKTIEITQDGYKMGLPPREAARFAALATLGGVLFYCLSCYQDWTLHSITTEDSIKKLTTGAFVYAIEATDAAAQAATLHAEAVGADLDDASRDTRDLQELKRLEDEQRSGPRLQWREKKMEAIRARVGSPSRSASVEAEVAILRRRSELLHDAANSLVALLERYKSHLRIRLWIEVVAPSILGLVAVWFAFR